ncbi:hypothetical protein, partial [Chryseobacterium sp. CH1]|uniref:hypothetical protein n=1 Tax=Chryseobacterium sp. CH1 TaxID=713551 RepID=UPI001026CE31
NAEAPELNPFYINKYSGGIKNQIGFFPKWCFDYKNLSDFQNSIPLTEQNEQSRFRSYPI